MDLRPVMVARWSTFFIDGYLLGGKARRVRGNAASSYKSRIPRLSNLSSRISR
jgi:hypothetical protein